MASRKISAVVSHVRRSAVAHVRATARTHSLSVQEELHASTPQFPWVQTLPLPALKPTPLVQLKENVYAKLEGAHESGSIKDRAVSYCVHGMVSRGELPVGGTLALCTSGSAGVALLLAQRQLLKQGVPFNVKIFMPWAYVERPIPQKIFGTPGVVIQEAVEFANSAGPASSLCPYYGNFVETLAHMKEQAARHNWKILDQHYDFGGVLAHRSTSEELMTQLPSLTDVVCATGTGATAAGLRQFLPEHITVHSRPAVSGTLDGCTDVRRYNNFCKPELLNGYTNEFFCPEEAEQNQERLSKEHDIHCGPSSGACFGLAQKIAEEKPDASIAFICADGRREPSCKFP